MIYYYYSMLGHIKVSDNQTTDKYLIIKD